MPTDMLLRYQRESVAAGSALHLATASPNAPEVFLDGFAERPAETAQALLCVARVARTRFYEPPGMVAARIRAADPVLTAEAARVRFESFSACCGVHARFDLLHPEGIDITRASSGTTNVDFNPPMREALARITSSEPLRITAGQDSVGVQTLEGTVIEHRVPLPQRWVSGFGEVQVALSNARLVLELSGIQTQRFLKSLPRGQAGDRTVWVESTGGTPRLASTPRPGAVCLAAPSRLRILEPVARFATHLQVYADPERNDANTVAWSLVTTSGRITLTLSPDRTRGFSGEGGLLLDLVAPGAAEDAETVSRLLGATGPFTLAHAATAAGISEQRVQTALTWLGIHGRIGYDVAESMYFPRRLPYPDEALKNDPARLRDAHELAGLGAVHLQHDGTAVVRSGRSEHRTTITAGTYRCSCPWIAKHGTSRGPCKHVLAAMLASHRRDR